MRIRTIKPQFWSHRIMARLEEFTQLLALALLNLADDEGYFIADPEQVRGQCMPFCHDLAKISRSLAKLSEKEWIEIGEDTAEHGPIGRIKNWEKHQKVDHPRDSILKGYFISSKISRENFERLREVGPADMDMDMDMEKGNGNDRYCAEPGIPAPRRKAESIEDKIYLEYPVKAPEGKSKVWKLLESKRREYAHTFDGMDVDFQLRKARQWCIDNPRKNKTVVGMPKFLFGWLERANNNGQSIKAKPDEWETKIYKHGEDGICRVVGIIPGQLGDPELSRMLGTDKEWTDDDEREFMKPYPPDHDDFAALRGKAS